MGTETTILFILVIFAGFYMAWSIGANDVANAMGTSVGSGALTLKQAVVIAGTLEFCGAFFFGSHVSETVQKGIVDPSLFMNNPIILVYGMLAALIAAGGWLQLASYYGWPVSTTHSIVGALVGFGLVVGGAEAIHWDNLIYIVSSWIISPLMGGLISFFIFRILTTKIFYRNQPVLAAKQLTPVLVFIVTIILIQVTVFKGLENINVEFTAIESLGISIAAGGVASLISYFLVKKIKVEPFSEKKAGVQNPSVSIGIEKAKKHLLRVKASASGEIHTQVSHLLDDLEDVAGIAEEEALVATQSQEYATVEKIFGYLQIMSASLMAFAHGANDVANAIGPIAASVNILTTQAISLTSTVPTWTLALGGVGIIFGLATWGWRVIETVGRKITELTPTRGFAAEFGAAATILFASRLGMPISTTHTLVGSVIGVGMARGLEALNLNTIRHIVISWIVTVPAGACLAVMIYFIISAIFGGS